MCSGNPVSSAVRAATDVMTFGTAEIGGVSSKLGNAVGNIGGSSTPGAPQLPQYPGMSPQEIQLLQQQQAASQQMGGIVNTTAGQLGNNQNILQQISGLFNSDGTINQNAVAQLQQSAQQSTQQAGQAGSAALAGLGGTGQALGATQQAYTQALQGNVPANQQLQYTQQQNFQAMKEQAAQQGINIQGDNWQNAVSNSTAGDKLIQNYQQNSNIQNQQYQLGYLGQLGTNMGQLAGVGATQANTGIGLGQYSQQTPLGYVGQSISQGPSALSPLLTQYQQGLQSQYSPYYMQQQGPYQQQIAQAQANYQAQMQQYQANQGMLGGIGSLAGMGIGGMIGGPAGAMIGGQMGSTLGGNQMAGGGMGVMAYPGMGGGVYPGGNMNRQLPMAPPTAVAGMAS
jgi:hypothetical protein